MTETSIVRADPPLTRFWLDYRGAERRHISLATRDPGHTWCGVEISMLSEDHNDGERTASTLCIECMGNGPTFDVVAELAPLAGRETLFVTVAEVGIKNVTMTEPRDKLVRLEGLPPRTAVARRLGLEGPPFAFHLAWHQGIGTPGS